MCVFVDAEETRNTDDVNVQDGLHEIPLLFLRPESTFPYLQSRGEPIVRVIDATFIVSGGSARHGQPLFSTERQDSCR